MDELNKQCNHDETNKCDCPCHGDLAILHMVPCCHSCKICQFKISFKKEVDTKDKVIIKDLNEQIETLKSEIENLKTTNRIYLNIIQNIYNLTKFIRNKADEPEELKPIVKKIFLETFRVELDR